MMDINIFAYLIFGIILLWKASLLMIEKKKILIFLPFFAIGILACFQAAFVFYEVHGAAAVLIVKSFYFMVLIWILIMIGKRKNGLFN